MLYYDVKFFIRTNDGILNELGNHRVFGNFSPYM